MTTLAADLDRALAHRARHGAAGRTSARHVARGPGWSVDDVLCTSGPGDRSFEECHERYSIVVVLAGSFAYRSGPARELLTPGSLLLGNAGQCYECGHEHGAGDRCLAFGFVPERFDRLAADAGAAPRARRFRGPRLPPLREIAPWVARAASGLVARESQRGPFDWEELGVELAARAVELAHGLAPGGTTAPANAEARIVRAARRIDRHPAEDHTLGALAAEAGLSPYHFLRTFERVTGVTPHQFVLRARLRAAAVRLAAEPARIVDVAFDCGFGDLANFNRAFRAELGASPRVFRRQLVS